MAFLGVREIYLYGNNIESIECMERMQVPDFEDPSLSNNMVDVGTNRINTIKSLSKGCSPKTKALFIDGNPVVDAEKWWRWSR